MAGLVDERKLADLVRAHQLVGLLQGKTGLRRDRVLLHHVGELHRVHRRVAHVAGGDHADKAFLVGVLDAQDELALVVAGDEPCVQRRS